MFPVSTTVRIVGALILAALLIGAVFAVRSCTTAPARQQAAGAKVQANLSDARAQSGADAVNDVGNQAAREAATQTLDRENHDAITIANGASTAVDPAVAAAGRLSLCRRAAYRDSEQCRGLLGPDPR